MKDILFQAVEVDRPGDDSRARGSAPEGGELIAVPTMARRWCSQSVCASRIGAA